MATNRDARRDDRRDDELEDVFTPYITRKGKRIYHPSGGLFHFKVKRRKR